MSEQQVCIELILNGISTLAFVVAAGSAVYAATIAKQGLADWQKQTRANIETHLQEKLVAAWVELQAALRNQQFGGCHIADGYRFPNERQRQNYARELGMLVDGLESAIVKFGAIATEAEIMGKPNADDALYLTIIKYRERRQFGRQLVLDILENKVPSIVNPAGIKQHYNLHGPSTIAQTLQDDLTEFKNWVQQNFPSLHEVSPN